MASEAVTISGSKQSALRDFTIGRSRIERHHNKESLCPTRLPVTHRDLCREIERMGATLAFVKAAPQDLRTVMPDYVQAYERLL